LVHLFLDGFALLTVTTISALLLSVFNPRASFLSAGLVDIQKA